MLMGIIIIRNKEFYQFASASQSHQLKQCRRVSITLALEPESSTEKNRLQTLMIMIIICIAQIASSLGRMTLPFCEHNRESLIGALAAMGHPAKQGGGLKAPPARLQTPDWRGFFPWMIVSWMNSTAFATPSSQSPLWLLPFG